MKQESDERSAGIERAAWQLEDSILGQNVLQYPTGAETLPACWLRLRLLHAQSWYGVSLGLLVLLSFFETPAWCDNTTKFWQHLPSEERCQGEGDMMLSGVPYLPPGLGLVWEAACLVFILYKFCLELRLQTRYFSSLSAPVWDEEKKEHKETRIVYIDLRQTYFGIFMILFEIADMTVFVGMRPHWRLAFISRTGYLCLLPAVQKLVECIRGVIKEFLSVAVFFYGFVLFFGWITATIFDDFADGKKGFTSFSEATKTMFVAGVCDAFLVVLLPSYTKRRWVGLLWFLFLVIAHILLLSLVLDTLCAAYRKYSEETAEEKVKKKVEGMFRAFENLSSATEGATGAGSQVGKEAFYDFTKALSRSPNIPTISENSAEVFFNVVDQDKSGEIEITEFCDICSVIQYEFWFTKKYSCLHRKCPGLWKSRVFQWYKGQVEPTNGNFDQLMTLILMLNFVLVIIESTYDLSGWEEENWMEWSEFVFSWIYVGEVLAKLTVFSFREYWSDFSNRFDFFTTWLLLGTSILEVVAKSSLATYANMLRLLRLLRVVKQLKTLPAVQRMADIVPKLVSYSTDILTLLAVVVYFFTALSLQVLGGLVWFGKESLEGSEYGEKMTVLNANDMFASLGIWVVMLMSEFEPALQEGVEKASGWIAALMFPLFYFMGVSIVFELVKAFTIEVFMELKKEYGSVDERAKYMIATFEADFAADGIQLHCRRVGRMEKEREIKKALREVCKEKGIEVGEGSDQGSAHGHEHH